MLSKLFLYYHTLRYLKAKQILWRLWYYVYKPKVKNLQAPPLRKKNIQLKPIHFLEKNQSLFSKTTFDFLNVAHKFKDVGWNPQNVEKLWCYNLHYFDDLNAVNAQRRKRWHIEFIQRWIKENPIGVGVGWEPYPTSLRVVNWIKWAIANSETNAFLLESLATQVRWLSQKLEFHILGNHLFSNAKALIFAGCFFKGSDAKVWLETGLGIVKNELEEQILPDGGNFERSPMYHSIFLEDLLDLIHIARIYQGCIPVTHQEMWEKVASQMCSWLQAMSHPDGEIPLFNDAAFGIAPCPERIFSYTKELDIPFTSPPQKKINLLRESGYICLQLGKMRAFLDVGPVGPDYLPGHAHADTLSFELSIGLKRFIVNGGTSCYGLSAQRQKERETYSHSTVEIEGQSSSQVWGGFRVAKRAYPFGLEVSENDITCSHNGYKLLPGNPVHTRHWELKQNSLIVTDTVTGRVAAISRFILHPDVVFSDTKEGIVLKSGDQTLLFKVLEGEFSIKDGSYAPEFGKVLPTKVIVLRFKSKNTKIILEW